LVCSWEGPIVHLIFQTAGLAKSEVALLKPVLFFKRFNFVTGFEKL
jgi:hypothetical protein